MHAKKYKFSSVVVINVVVVVVVAVVVVVVVVINVVVVVVAAVVINGVVVVVAAVACEQPKSYSNLTPHPSPYFKTKKTSLTKQKNIWLRILIRGTIN